MNLKAEIGLTILDTGRLCISTSEAVLKFLLEDNEAGRAHVVLEGRKGRIVSGASKHGYSVALSRQKNSKLWPARIQSKKNLPVFERPTRITAVAANMFHVNDTAVVEFMLPEHFVEAQPQLPLLAEAQPQQPVSSDQIIDELTAVINKARAQGVKVQVAIETTKLTTVMMEL